MDATVPQTLSIRLRPGGFSFSCGHDEPTHVTVPAGPDHTRALIDAILSRDELLADFADVRCQVDTVRFVLVPPTADDAEARALYTFTLPEVATPEVILADGPFRFGIDADLYDFLCRTYVTVAFTHPLERLRALCGDNAPLLAQTPPQPSLRPLAQLIARVEADAIDILLYRGALHLANRYETHDINNMAYYLLNTWKQCDLDALRDSILLTGDASIAARLRVIIAPLVRNLTVRCQTLTEEN